VTACSRSHVARLLQTRCRVVNRTMSSIAPMQRSDSLPTSNRSRQGEHPRRSGDHRPHQGAHHPDRRATQTTPKPERRARAPARSRAARSYVWALTRPALATTHAGAQGSDALRSGLKRKRPARSGRTVESEKRVPRRRASLWGTRARACAGVVARGSPRYGATGMQPHARRPSGPHWAIALPVPLLIAVAPTTGTLRAPRRSFYRPAAAFGTPGARRPLRLRRSPSPMRKSAARLASGLMSSRARWIVAPQVGWSAFRG
jgi:hypothetical protein